MTTRVVAALAALVVATPVALADTPGFTIGDVDFGHVIGPDMRSGVLRNDTADTTSYLSFTISDLDADLDDERRYISVISPCQTTAPNHFCTVPYNLPGGGGELVVDLTCTPGNPAGAKNVRLDIEGGFGGLGYGMADARVTCSFGGSGFPDASVDPPDADPAAPDADPDAPDADPNAPDGRPGGGPGGGAGGDLTNYYACGCSADTSGLGAALALLALVGRRRRRG